MIIVDVPQGYRVFTREKFDDGRGNVEIREMHFEALPDVPAKRPNNVSVRLVMTLQGAPGSDPHPRYFVAVQPANGMSEVSGALTVLPVAMSQWPLLVAQAYPR